MGVTVYGASDDLIEVEGDVREEFGGGESGDVLVFSDGTALRVAWEDGVWRIRTVRRGTAELSIERAPDEYDEDNNTDRATLTGQITGVWHETEFRLGEVAYSGYFKASLGRSLVSGEELPSWDELAPAVQVAWLAAADAVREVVDQ